MRLDDGKGGGPLLRVTATHLLVGVSAVRAGDAVAVVDGGPGPRRVFVPSPLPCGECPYCRRALTAACPNQRTPISLDQHTAVDVPDRFITELGEPAWGELRSEVVAGAGLVAEILDATARSGLGPGDTAIWIGDEPWVSLGAAFSARRSCRTFTVGVVGSSERSESAASAAVGEPIVTLPATETPGGWQATIAAAEAASGAGPGRPERRIFVFSAEPAWATMALHLAAPGATLAFRRGLPGQLVGFDGLVATRVLVGGGYHPDLIPEALAVLARGQLDISQAIRLVAEADRDSALTLSGTSTDRRFPLVSLV
ncbi:MAG TPA: hypothetical protein VH374_18535 [Polyangia bacterium]|jgi:threonine dehydrogenase-like Zn-dependent dehydrogenase|nr:hypothetical protein [Polyangia bacterium]